MLKSWYFSSGGGQMPPDPLQGAGSPTCHIFLLLGVCRSVFSNRRIPLRVPSKYHNVDFFQKRKRFLLVISLFFVHCSVSTFSEVKDLSIVSITAGQWSAILCGSVFYLWRRATLKTLVPQHNFLFLDSRLSVNSRMLHSAVFHTHRLYFCEHSGVVCDQFWKFYFF